MPGGGAGAAGPHRAPGTTPAVSPQVGSHRDISHESLSLFRLLEPQIGTRGMRGARCPPFGLLSGGLCGSLGPCRKGRSGPGQLECCPAHPCRALVAEILVLGTGDRVERLHPATLKQMRECGIAVEVQDTVRKGERRQHPIAKEGGGHVPCGEGPTLLSEGWSFTHSLFCSQANACATFNFLVNERRLVAAGLIPPRGTYM